MLTNADRGQGRRALVTLSLILALALAAESLAPAISLAKARRDHGVHGQIVGGQAVRQGDLTFMAFVLFQVGSDRFQCGGSLIDATHVLTAGHCADDGLGNVLPPDAYTIFIGKANIDDFGPDNEFGVSQVQRHPDFDRLTPSNDAAVLTLNAAVPASIARPLRLAQSGKTSDDTAGKDAVVAGWGTTASGGIASAQLLKTTVQLTSDSACSAAYGSGFQPSVMICAAAPGRDSCQGDSGGPLIVKEKTGAKMKKYRKGKNHRQRHKRQPVFADVASGIVSFGEGCADPDFPGVYTRITAPEINSFITNALGN
jgi:secreted trypsin-like serine protease